MSLRSLLFQRHRWDAGKGDIESPEARRPDEIGAGGDSMSACPDKEAMEQMIRSAQISSHFGNPDYRQGSQIGVHLGTIAQHQAVLAARARPSQSIIVLVVRLRIDQRLGTSAADIKQAAPPLAVHA